jgi:O-antigen ligase
VSAEWPAAGAMPSASAALPGVRRDPLPAAARRTRRELRVGVVIAMAYAAGLALARLIDVADDGKAMLAFGTTFTVVVVASALLQPRWFVPLVVAYLPFSRVYALPVAGITGANLTNLLLSLGLLAWLAGRAKPRRRLRIGPPELLVAAYVAYGSLSVLTASRAGTDLLTLALAYRAWLAPMLLFFIVRGLVCDRQEATAILQVMAWTTTLVGALTWVEGLDRSSRSSIEAARVGGLMMQPNSMGAFFVYYGVPLLAYGLCARPLARGAPYFGGFLVAARAVLFTFSRGAYLGLAAGATVVSALRRPLLLVIAGGASVLAVLVHPELVPESVRERMGATRERAVFDGETDSASLDRSSADRIVIWRGAARMIVDKPLFGVGLGQFGPSIGLYTEYALDERHPRDAHNAFFAVAGEMGLPALFLLLLFLAALAATAARMYFGRRISPDRPLGLACLGMLVGLVVTCMLGSRFSDESLIGYFWMLAALTVVVSRLPLPHRPSPRPRWR